MKNIDFNKLWPHLVAIIVFIAISFIYFSPLLEGKKLYQGDITNFQGMSQEIKEFRKETGEEPLWTNSMFGGMPAYQISVKYSANLIKHVDKALMLWLPRPANYLFLLMIGFYFLMLMLKADWRLAMAGAFAFAFSSYSLIVMEAGHNSKVHAMAYMAPVIGSIILTYRGKYLLGAALTALFLALQISTNHLQITYYLLLTILVLGIVKLIFAIQNDWLPQFAKASGFLIVAAIIAIGPNITNLWATAEYGKYTMRGKSELSSRQESSGLDRDYALRWSYGIDETLTILIPNFKGGASQGDLSEKSETYQALVDNNVPKRQAKQIIQNLPLYWGDQPFTSGPVYFGAIVCLLFVFGLFVIKTNDKWWLLGAAILSIVLSWGRHFPIVTDLFFDYFPFYNKFRAVSMTLVIAQLVFPLMALMAVKQVLNGDFSRKEIQQKLLYSFYITGGLTLIFVLFPGMFFDFVSEADDQLASSGFPGWLIDAIQDDRKSMLRMDALRSFVFMLLGCGVIWLGINEKLKRNVTLLALAVLILADLALVDRRYLNEENFVREKQVEQPFTPTQADLQILQDQDPNFRVYHLGERLDQSARTSYFHKNLGGYHGAKLKRYQELIDFHLSQRNMAVINMMNTKYFIVPPQEEGQQTRAQRNPEALGNAWFVEEYEIVPNADAEIEALNDFDPAETAIVDQRFQDHLQGFEPKYDSLASIRLTSYEPNHLVYESEANKEQLAVFSEIYYPEGWNAYVDGELKPHFRVNYVLRAMRIPAGKHKIEFKFEPKVYAVGEKISLATSILLFLIVGGALFYQLRRGGEKEES